MAALPYVKINFANGLIGGTEPMDDGVTLVLMPSLNLAADADCLTYDDFVEKTGKTSDLVKAFFNEAGGKTRLIVSGKPTAADKVEASLKALLDRFHGDIRNVIITNVPDLAYLKILQGVGEWAAAELFAPVTFIVSLADTYYKTNPQIKTFNLNRVTVADNVTDEETDGVPLVWYLAGRAARIPVQRSVARVQDGAVFAPEFYYPDGQDIRLVSNNYAEGKHSLGFVTVRTFIGKAGYYFSDDLMATAASDDYGLLPRRRVIDKAYRIAYQTLVNYIGDELPVLESGAISPVKAKDIQNAVEQAVYNSMTLEGNLGVDDKTADKGVSVFVDPAQNVLATSKLAVTMRVKPYGYAKYIEVDLGYAV